jgi:hypothetical protein
VALQGLPLHEEDPTRHRKPVHRPAARRAPEVGHAHLPQGRQDQQEFPEGELTQRHRQLVPDRGTAGSDIIPMDQVSLNFAKIEYKYKEQKADGSLGGEIIGGWDVTTNKPV